MGMYKTLYKNIDILLKFQMFIQKSLLDLYLAWAIAAIYNCIGMFFLYTSS